MLSRQGQSGPQEAQRDSARGQSERERAIVEEGPLPTASVGIPPRMGAQAGPPTQGSIPRPRDGSLAPTPGRMHRQLSHHASFLGCMGRSSFSPAPGRLPGPSQLMVYTLSPGGECRHPPAAQLQLGSDLQEASAPPRPPQPGKYLAASPERGRSKVRKLVLIKHLSHAGHHVKVLSLAFSHPHPPKNAAG